MNTKPSRVDIALATYNGARYLPEQLASLAKQHYPHIRVCVSDDGSRDETMELVAAANSQLDIHVAPISAEQNIARNFENALRCTEAPYVALSDQDDVWEPHKISLLKECVAGLESRYGASVPALAFCDLAIVDEDLNIINESYFRSSIKSNQAKHFRDFVINNHVPGCAMLMNRALLDMALPFPNVDIHDHWLIQVASLFGHVGYVDLPLVQYRQHGSNSIGLAHFGENKLAKVFRVLNSARSELTIRRKVWTKQAGSICNNMSQLRFRFGDRLPSEGRDIIDAILEHASARRINRLLHGARHGDRWVDYRGVLHALAARQ